MATRAQINAAPVEALTAAAEGCVSGSISAVEFAEELTPRMTSDVQFWSNYRPSWEPLRPLFAERRGIDEIVARYDYEHQHEAIEPGSTIPTNNAIAGDVMNLTRRETARFFDRGPVTWEMVIRIELQGGLIDRIQMFLDSAPIEAVYGRFAGGGT